MRHLLILFYCQDPGWILFFAYLATLGFLAIWRSCGTRSWFRPLCSCLLLFWGYVLLQLTILHRIPGSCDIRQPVPLHFLWQIYTTGNWELLRSMFMNAALFFPAGLLLTALVPRSWSRRRATVTVCLTFLLVSMAVEGLQLVYAMGQAEADDVLFNVLGAFLGTLPFPSQRT